MSLPFTRAILPVTSFLICAPPKPVTTISDNPLTPLDKPIVKKVVEAETSRVS